MNKLTRKEAIKVFSEIIDQDGNAFEIMVEEWYDEDADEMPSLEDVFEAIGVTNAEYREANGIK